MCGWCGVNGVVYFSSFTDLPPHSDFFHTCGVSIPKAWSIKAPQSGGRGGGVFTLLLSDLCAGTGISVRGGLRKLDYYDTVAAVRYLAEFHSVCWERKDEDSTVFEIGGGLKGREGGGRGDEDEGSWGDLGDKVRRSEERSDELAAIASDEYQIQSYSHTRCVSSKYATATILIHHPNHFRDSLRSSQLETMKGGLLRRLETGLQRSRKHKTIIHGSFIGRNLAFYPSSNPSAYSTCASFDFKMAGRGYGVYDLAMLLCESVDPDLMVRDQREEEFLEIYFHHLGESLRARKVRGRGHVRNDKIRRRFSKTNPYRCFISLLSVLPCRRVTTRVTQAACTSCACFFTAPLSWPKERGQGGGKEGTSTRRGGASMLYRIWNGRGGRGGRI